MLILPDSGPDRISGPSNTLRCHSICLSVCLSVCVLPFVSFPLQPTDVDAIGAKDQSMLHILGSCLFLSCPEIVTVLENNDFRPLKHNSDFVLLIYDPNLSFVVGTVFSVLTHKWHNTDSSMSSTKDLRAHDMDTSCFWSFCVYVSSAYQQYQHSNLNRNPWNIK